MQFSNKEIALLNDQAAITGDFIVVICLRMVTGKFSTFWRVVKLASLRH
jgi:hypothetical protein